MLFLNDDLGLVLCDYRLQFHASFNGNGLDECRQPGATLAGDTQIFGVWGNYFLEKEFERKFKNKNK